MSSLTDTVVYGITLTINGHIQPKLVDSSEIEVCYELRRKVVFATTAPLIKLIGSNGFA
jgi:hypothetical protein